MSWKPQDQSKKHVDKRPYFRGHSKDGRGANRFTSLTRMPKEILAAEANKFQLPPPMVTLVEKRNSNKFCDFHNDKGHSTDECMQLKKQIEELAIQAVPSTVHGMLKFPTEKGIVTIRSSLLIPAECASVDTSSETPREKKTHPANLAVTLYPNFPDQEVVVGGSLSDKGRTKLCSLLKKNLDVFAWQPSDMTGVPRSVAEHILNIQEGCLPGVYCYTKMPFGLKNAGATYQRLMDKAFESQMGRNIEVYVDDLVVKSHTEAEMVRDIEETFQTQRKINMKLNPKKMLVRISGRSIPWSIMLGEHNITYRPRTSIKGQILAEFLNEIPGDASQGVSVAVTQEEPWTLFTDGSSCVDGSAEYEALIGGSRIATQIGVKNVQANVDSKLVGNQVLGTYVAKEDNMIKYLEIAKGLVSGFKTFSISQVPRGRNKKADALSKIVSTSFAHLSKQVLVEVLETKSIIGKEVTAVIEEEGPTWMTELVNYLKEGILPRDEKEARKLSLKAQYVMKEIHEGSCSMHAGPRSVVAKAIRLGYFLSIMHKDVQDMIRKCSDCQIQRPVTRHPQQPLTPITAP
nr:reverse transcriptase domain-containing protein [Tanacetum cinerariifolium]